MDRISYNEKKGMYEYKINDQRKISLRTDSGYVVTEQNYHDLKRELFARNNRYFFDKRLEDAGLLKHSDFQLAKQYFEANKNIKEGAYKEALKNIDQVLRIYPGAEEYSDALFLKAYAYEKLGMPDRARSNYHWFLRSSSGKFSKRFRSYRDADTDDSLFTLERIHTRKFLNEEKNEVDQGVFTAYTPSYHFNSFHPGYIMNPEDLVEGSNTFFWFLSGYNLMNEYATGFQIYHRFTTNVDLNTGIFYEDDSYGMFAAAPIQFYRSLNNDLGVKISPFFSYYKFNSMEIEGIATKVDRSFVDIGTKFSIGYYISQNLSFGAYYTYHFHNEINPYSVTNKAAKFWYENSYDISAYYNIYQMMSLKGGIKNGHPAIGIVLSGFELSFTKDEVINTIELF